MKNFINIINEGMDPRSNHPAFAGDDVIDDVVDTGGGHDEFERMFRDIFAPLHNLANRAQIEDVYEMVLDGAPFEDAVSVVADSVGMDKNHLRALAIADYKKMRGDSDLYATEFGHSLVSKMNAQIHESLNEAVILSEREGSMKVGAYTNKAGDRLIILRSPLDKTHHMVMNAKGEVKETIMGDAMEVRRKMFANGFEGAITDAE